MTLSMREQEKYDEGVEYGEARGLIKFALKLDYPSKDIIVMLQNELNINAEQAEDYLKRYNDGTL